MAQPSGQTPAPHNWHVGAVGWEPHGSSLTAWMLHVASVCTPSCICVLLRVIAQSFKTVKLLATPRLACLASVSNRVIARKLERKRKIKRCKREGEGRRGSFFPLPLPRHSFFFCSRSRRTRAETLATQATPRLFIGATGQRVHPNEEENMATCFHGGQRIR